MPVFNVYWYRPLFERDAIRLVLLDPSTDETAPLTCQIVEHRLSAQDLDYSAVSYAWGEHSLSQILEVKSDGDVQYLRITPNVETLLIGFRQHNKPRYLWIDTICFNQNDDVEKAQQIPVMGDIYKKARTVDIWLGLDNHMTARVLAFFRKLSRIPDVTEWRTQWKMAGRISFLMKKFIHHNAGTALEAILDFFQQPWFSRRWIIQEACLARCGTVHCGKHSIALDVLSQAATRFQRLDLSDYAIKVAANLGHQTTQLNMLELLWHFHNSDCREPKDRIAGFISLARDGHNLCLDYTKPWHEIFRSVASITYNLGDNDVRLQLLLHLFEFGSVVKKEDLSYPSWVPNWSSSRQRRLPYISAPKNLDTYELYPSSPGHAEKATVAFNQGYLQMPSTSSDPGLQILRVGSTMTFHHSQGAEDFRRQHMYDVIEELFPHIPNAKLHIVALALLLRTVSQFRHPDMEREKTSKSLGRFEQAFEEQFANMDCRQLLIWLRTLESVLYDFCLVELETFGHGPSTSQGYGIGTEMMLVDDITIPLWTLQANDPESGVPKSVLGTNFHISTMLVVRRDNVQARNVINGDGHFEQHKIIGPAVCITWSQAQNDSECPPESAQCTVVDYKHFFPIRIS